MKIAIADDHNLVREGLAAVLVQSCEVSSILEAASVSELYDHLESHSNVALAILDLNMPGMEDVKTLDCLQQTYPTTSFAILSATEIDAVAKRFLNAGAVGYLPKSLKNEVLVDAIHLILSGGVYVPSFASHSKTEKGFHVTQRQSDVLALMAEGLSNKEIALKLDITESTVKTHISAILKALGVDNRMKAIRESIRLGLVAEA